MPHLREDAARGFAAGALATVGMSVLMFAARRAGVLGRMPPERITSHFLDRFHVRRRKQTQDLLAAILHIGFGAAAGAAFGVACPRVRAPLPGLLQGLLFGTAVWTVSYFGWVPALGIMPPPPRDRPGRPETMLAAHWIYGGMLALLTERP
jgi:hypothetical protein